MKSLLFIISAPSGTGKTSLCKEVIRNLSNLTSSVSYTTRKPRSGEMDGRDYFFVSPEKFQQMLDQGLFREWTEIYGNRYGTSKAFIEKLMKDQVDILFDIDSRGARKILELYPEGISIFVLPPSLQELKKRLISRGTDSPETITSRLKLAEQEMEDAGFYQYTVVNDSFEEAVKKLKSIVIAERCRRRNGIC
ncbi:MAG TPA: guanylate kinase [Thermodesulfobacteriota bacterium]|jgi:guanylate kinase|nr:guanylate kinase [Thermodesulfobacteriota bacterium]